MSEAMEILADAALFAVLVVSLLGALFAEKESLASNRLLWAVVTLLLLIYRAK